MVPKKNWPKYSYSYKSIFKKLGIRIILFNLNTFSVNFPQLNPDLHRCWSGSEATVRSTPAQGFVTVQIRIWDCEALSSLRYTCAQGFLTRETAPLVLYPGPLHLHQLFEEGIVRQAVLVIRRHWETHNPLIYNSFHCKGNTEQEEGLSN